MEYHQDRFDDFSLMVFKGEHLIGVLPANRVKKTVYSHQGLTYGGLVLSKVVKFEEVLDAFKAILKYLESHEVTMLQLKVIPKIYCIAPCDEIEYLLFKVNAKLFRTDLTVSIDNDNALELNSSNRKRGLKKALKNNLVIKETDDFESFWNQILIPNLQKKHNVLPTHTLHEITDLSQKFPESIKQFNVYNDEKIVAGVTIFETKTVAHAQYISANEQKQELGSLDFIFDHLINEVYKNKRFFDFGISNENQGQHVNTGLMAWKESFGARAIAHQFYEIETANHYLLNAILL